MTEPSDIAESGVAAAELLQFVERLEHLAEEKEKVADDMREVFAEVKHRGFDVAAIRQILKLRKQDRDERAEAESILELYMNALGMS